MYCVLVRLELISVNVSGLLVGSVVGCRVNSGMFVMFCMLLMVGICLLVVVVVVSCFILVDSVVCIVVVLVVL